MNIRPWLKRKLIGVLTAAAIVVGTVIQLSLIVGVCVFLPDQIAEPAILVSPFAVGVGSYFVLHWITRRREIRIEAEQWLARRSRRSPHQRAWLYHSKQVGVWVPAVLVTISFLFAPELFGVATQFLYGRPAIINGYEVHRPVTWMVFDAVFPNNEESQNARAFGFKGPLRSGFSGFMGLNPRASTMSFSSAPDPDRFLQDRKTVSGRTLQIGQESVECSEYVHVFPHLAFDEKNEAIRCQSAGGKLFASFYGDKSSISEFYETLRNARKR